MTLVKQHDTTRAMHSATHAPDILAYPALTTVFDATHGMVDVRSRWCGDHWEHTVPSHKSNPGGVHHVTGNDCSCPARSTCYHLMLTHAAETGMREWCWHLLRHYLRFDCSGDDYAWGMARLAETGLDKVTARAVLDMASAQAQERAMGRVA